MQSHPSDAVPRVPSDEELARMSTEDLVRLGNRLDDIEIVSERDRFPVPGTRAEKRAERQVAGWFILATLSGIAFLVAFIAWPWEYVAPFEEGAFWYTLYTPVIGFTFGFAVFALGMGVIAYSKKLLPEDLTIQQRHDGRSPEVDRRTAAARLVQTGQRSGLTRRKMVVRSVGAAGGVLGVGVLVAAFGGFIKNPWKEGPNSPLLVTDWHSEDGERVYLRRNTGVAEDVVLVRPGDLEPGSMETVYPFKESMRTHPEELAHVLKSPDSPVMLIRLRPNVTVIKREGQQDFNYGTLFAYSKICTHMGCPTSLYEDQTNRILCPCHQSQFLANEYAKPIFGPAARPLPQLPIAVDDQGYLYARSDFIEPVGPAFWERNS
ncbi:ubiquinol-cytochrome c reductase iron-sulfur subunit [Actinomycetospora cinnamomea]|uniref:Cytochrome bc1 complex Rieske iron-sulfur subunit n=1 Tax=Actinomycetospora cinnamomea TaxID=663609 RepID=A0A2U1F9V5_9PSEU|nr:ubiquinol-cytochrome c reductase iron-sulfur subunit [Actinomycetospora cinnamomea]PVZ08965.1 menaquinol-cytochrome c reductase iron-sulfur subunit precursor [Actinomycetospora cinnamomea]